MCVSVSVCVSVVLCVCVSKVLCVRVYKAMDGGDIGIFAVNTEAEFTNMTLRIPGA